MAYSLRRLFATLLVFCSPTDPAHLGASFQDRLSEDIRKEPLTNPEDVNRKTLESIHFILQSMRRSINEYSLTNEPVRLTEEDKFTNEFLRKKDIVVSDVDLRSATMLNTCQKATFDAIMSAFNTDKDSVFFVNEPGGLGKTFLYRALLAHVRSRVHIALSVATSGVTASLLPGGHTTHSRFKFLLEIDANAESNLSKESSLARLIKSARLIVWDEVTMANRCVIESLDKLLRDVFDSATLFGRKIVLFGGDFRQTLPIVVGGSRNDMIRASVVSSPLWSSIQKYQLDVNMRACDDPNFRKFCIPN